LISDDTPVADIVREKPGLARVFEEAGINYCCGGKMPLSEACNAKGLDVETMVKVLNSIPVAGAQSESSVDSYSSKQLIEHIVSTHHAYLRRELPRLQRLTREVAESHGEEDPRLIAIAERYARLMEKLLAHQSKEEDHVFPNLIGAEEGSRTPPPQAEIDNLVREHEEVGELLRELRGLSDGYIPQEWMCNTTRTMLHALSELEADVHTHVHKENNILFPRFRTAS